LVNLIKVTRNFVILFFVTLSVFGFILYQICKNATPTTNVSSVSSSEVSSSFKKIQSTLEGDMSYDSFILESLVFNTYLFSLLSLVFLGLILVHLTSLYLIKENPEMR
jgi:hypothetical protein